MKCAWNFSAIAWIALGFSLLPVSQAFAQWPNYYNPHAVNVLNAAADLSNRQLTIEGGNFPRSALVVLNGQSLTIASLHPTTIVADLPATILSTPGSYALTIEQPRHTVLALPQVARFTKW